MKLNYLFKLLVCLECLEIFSSKLKIQQFTEWNKFLTWMDVHQMFSGQLAWCFCTFWKILCLQGWAGWGRPQRWWGRNMSAKGGSPLKLQKLLQISWGPSSRPGTPLKKKIKSQLCSMLRKHFKNNNDTPILLKNKLLDEKTYVISLYVMFKSLYKMLDQNECFINKTCIIWYRNWEIEIENRILLKTVKKNISTFNTCKSTPLNFLFSTIQRKTKSR